MHACVRGCPREHACASAAVSYGAADRVMHCRGTEKDQIPRESNRGALTPHTIAHRDREPVNYWNIDATGH